MCHAKEAIIKIIGTGKAVPPKRVSNDELAAKIDTTDEWIRSHTGIGSRYIADENISCSDLAVEAAKNALAMAAGYTGDDVTERDNAALEAAQSIDLIILATATADHFGTPSTACIVQDGIKAYRAAAMDITVGCTGFVYGLETAAGLLSIDPARKRALVIGSEILSKMIDWDDRRSCVLFGDGAGAVVLEKTNEGGSKSSGLKRSLLYADGTGKSSLIMKRGGTREPFKKGEVLDMGICLEMNGQEVYNFAVKAITDTLGRMMNTGIDGETKLNIDDIAWIVPHQANARIVTAAAKRLGIPIEKFYLNIEEYANTSAATIPIALDEMQRNGKIKRGDLILTVGFGGGLTYGGNIIVW